MNQEHRFGTIPLDVALRDAGYDLFEINLEEVMPAVDDGKAYYKITFSTDSMRYYYNIQADTNIILARKLKSLEPVERFPDKDRPSDLGAEGGSEIAQKGEKSVPATRLAEPIKETNHPEISVQERVSEAPAQDKDEELRDKKLETRLVEPIKEVNEEPLNQEVPLVKDIAPQLADYPEKEGRLSGDQAFDWVLADLDKERGESHLEDFRLGEDQPVAYYETWFSIGDKHYHYILHAGNGAVLSRDIQRPE